MTEKQKPATLFKYQSANIQNLVNLRNRSIYFSSPQDFNDPYDCSNSLIIREPNIEDVPKFRELMSEVLQNKSENQKHTLLRSFLNEGTDKEVHEHMKMLAKGTPERELVDDLKRPGVSCFSDNNDNILMWAHYAESFKGYCLEFRTDNDFFDTVEHVKYVKDFMAVDLVPLLLEEAVSTEAIFLTKSFHWDSESEWRLLSNQQRVSFNYDKDILTAVYFGPRMEKALIEIIYLILEATNSDVKYWLGKLNKGEYRVDFEEYKFPDY